MQMTLLGSPGTLKEIFQKLEKLTRRQSTWRYGVTRITLDSSSKSRMQVGNIILRSLVGHFEYLGVTFTYNNEKTKRVRKGSKSAGSLNGLLKSKKMSKNAKIRVLYACETWVFNKDIGRKEDSQRDFSGI